MGEPKVIGEVVLDQGLLDRLRALAPEPIAPVIGPESDEERDRRVAQRQASRERLWQRRVPSRFTEATVDTLTVPQNPGARVATWWRDGGQNLVLRATKSGVGKSHAAVAVGHQAVTDGAWAMFWTMVDLNDALRPGGDDTAYDVARECDLLVLDDLGRERMTEWTIERLTGVLDGRWSNGKRTVITTNLSGEAVRARYGDPVLDRIQDGLWAVEITGESRRAKAPW